MDAFLRFCKNDWSDILTSGPGIGSGARSKDSDSGSCAVCEESAIKKALFPAIIDGALLHRLPSLSKQSIAMKFSLLSVLCISSSALAAFPRGFEL